MGLMDNWLQGHKHCDDYIDDESAHPALRAFLDFNRLPAIDKGRKSQVKGFKEPKLFADHKGKRVKVVMASRFGDVGITDDLTREYGYNLGRVAVDELTNFSDCP